MTKEQRTKLEGTLKQEILKVLSDGSALDSDILSDIVEEEVETTMVEIISRITKAESNLEDEDEEEED